jgi:hypothetical protein
MVFTQTDVLAELLAGGHSAAGNSSMTTAALTAAAASGSTAGMAVLLCGQCRTLSEDAGLVNANLIVRSWEP